MDTLDFKTRTSFAHRHFPCPKDKWVVGLDIGYSGVKGMSPNKIYCFPAYARKVPKERIVLSEPAETDIRYKDGNGTWVIGNLAYDEVVASEVPDSEAELFGRHRYYSHMFQVIARAGIAMGLTANSYGNRKDRKILIQSGLPPKYVKSDTPYIKAVLSGDHEFSIKLGRSPWQRFQFSLAEDDIHIIPQPLGALISASVDREGNQLSNAKKYFRSNVIIFDPGFGTTDDYTVKMGNVVNAETFPDLGMREVFARTCKDISERYGVDISIPELQNLLANGTIRVMDRISMKRKSCSFADILKENSQKVCEETVSKMKSVHEYFTDCDYIIATGGTYDAWAEQFNAVFGEMEGLKIIPGNINDPVFSNIYSNVRGYYFFLCSRLDSPAKK